MLALRITKRSEEYYVSVWAHAGGKTCRSVVLQIISEKTGVPISESRLGAFRPPVIPLPIDAIVRYAKGVDTDE